MAISRDLANQIIGFVLGNRSFVPSSTLYLGLCSQSPQSDGTLQTGSEPPDNIGYKRLSINNNTSEFSTPAFDSTHTVAFVTNLKTWTMDEITGGSGTQVGYFFLADSGTNSNNSGASKKVLMWGAFDNPRTLAINSNLVIEAGGAIFEIINTNT